MLTLLHIENIALIEEVDIEFQNGFHVLTGETGAGKSIVVDSLSAVLGERTSRDLIRTGSKSALVSASFMVETPLKWLEENGFEPEGELILQREMRPDGKNTCRLNGKPVTVAQLKELGKHLLHIHGQHDGQQLLDPACHLGYLDGFGKTAACFDSYTEHYQQLGKISTQIRGLQVDESEKARKMDSLSFQINELERAELVAGEDEVLASKKAMLRNTGKLMEGLEQAMFALYGDEDNAGACALLRVGGDSLRKLSPELTRLSEQLEEVRCIADDVGETLRDFGREIDITPEELDQMESRLDQLDRLKKKYGNSCEEMIAYLARCREELEEISTSGDQLARLEKQLEKQLVKTQQSAQKLTEVRRAAGEQLQARVENELRQLDMPKVQFCVEFEGKTCQWQLDESGADKVQFLMSANLGETLKPIQKVASGGELARIMLAMKNVLAQDDKIATLVFDEVDAGVSGRAAQKVAEKMSDVAQHKQVLCVTHLPQIAAMADHHLQVEKGEVAGRTYTALTQLDRTGRQNELARLMGGSTITQAIVDSAEELLTQADHYRSGRT